jgi:hypothetical protein
VVTCIRAPHPEPSASRLNRAPLLPVRVALEVLRRPLECDLGSSQTRPADRTRRSASFE